MPLPSFNDALTIVRQHMITISAPKVLESVPLLEALHRILAEPILADRDQPPFDRSTRDGYALNSASAGDALNILGTLRAGDTWNGAPLGMRDSVEIMTGASVPIGADAVAMIEHVEHPTAGTIKLVEGRSVGAGENIVRRGAEAQAGQELASAGTRISAAEIALFAACGYATIVVYKKPRVAILATGDELVGIQEQPAPHQIRNSNTYALAAAVVAVGGEPLLLKPAKDTQESLTSSIAQSSGCDLLLLSGGVSAGKYDFVEEVLLSLGSTFHFTGAAIQPGKPVVFGTIASSEYNLPAYVYGLPGNPVSTQVTFHLFVEPLLRHLAGEQTNRYPSFAQATLTAPISGKQGITRFLPAILQSDLTRPTVALTNWQGSGDLHANARANCYAVLPAHGDNLNAGDVITVLLR